MLYSTKFSVQCIPKCHLLRGFLKRASTNDAFYIVFFTVHPQVSHKTTAERSLDSETHGRTTCTLRQPEPHDIQRLVPRCWTLKPFPAAKGSPNFHDLRLAPGSYFHVPPSGVERNPSAWKGVKTKINITTNLSQSWIQS